MFHPSDPANMPRSSKPSPEGGLRLRTAVNAGVESSQCRIKQEGFCATMCCPTPQGEECTSVCPQQVVY